MTFAMLKDEINQLRRDILDQDCEMIDDLLAVHDHTLQLLEHELRKIEVSEQIEIDELAKVRGKKVC